MYVTIDLQLAQNLCSLMQAMSLPPHHSINIVQVSPAVTQDIDKLLLDYDRGAGSLEQRDSVSLPNRQKGRGDYYV